MTKPTDLRGIIVPIVTPITDGDAVDYEGLRRVVRHVLNGGVHGVFALGGTGNFCSFTSEERVQITRVVVEEVAGRVPVLVGCMDSHTRLVARNAKLAAEAGADVAVVEPPYYYPCTDDDVITHFRTVAQASRLPVVIYNIPAANKVTINIHLTKKLAALPGLIGIKDSTMDFYYFQELLSAFSGSPFRLIQGQEPLAGPSFLQGAHAAILACGNMVPKLCVELYEAGSAGKFEEARRLHQQLQVAFSIFRQYAPGDAGYYTTTVSSFFTGLQCALDILGVCRRVLTVPYPNPSPADYERVKATLTQLGVAPAIA